MKKLTAILLIVAMLLTLGACSKKSDDANGPIKIGVLAPITGANAEHGKSYQVRVFAAYTKDGKTQYLSATDATVVEAALVLGDRVVGLKATVEGRKILVSWNAYPNATKYFVHVFNPDGSKATTVQAATNSAVVANAIQAEIDYTIKVTAQIGSTFMSYNDALGVTARLAVAAPNTVTAPKIYPKSASITWNSVKGCQEYYVRVTKDGTTIRTWKATTNYLTISGLEANTTYGIEVNAVVESRLADGRIEKKYSGYGDMNMLTTSSFENLELTAEVVDGDVIISWKAPTEGSAVYFWVYESGEPKATLLGGVAGQYTRYRVKNAASGEHSYKMIGRINYNGVTYNTGVYESNSITL